MGLYYRDDSPFVWMACERPGQRPLRASTGIPREGGTPDQTAANKALAQAVYAATMGDLARGRHQLGGGPAKPTITFGAFRAWWEREVLPTERHQKRNASMLRQAGRFFDARELHTLTKPDGIAWQRARSEEVAHGTVNRETARLKSFLNLAIPTYLDANPFAGLSELPTDEGEPQILSVAGEADILALADPVETALIVCALDTLQRLSTVAAFARKEDHGSYLTVLRPKGRGKRIPYKVPISRRLREALDAVPKEGPLYFARYQRRNAESTRNAVEVAFAALCRRAGVTFGRAEGGITFHSLRHTGASRMLNRGVDIKTVAEIGNWKNVAVLQKYLHPIGDAREQAVELVGSPRPVHAKSKIRHFRRKTAS